MAHRWVNQYELSATTYRFLEDKSVYETSRQTMLQF